MPDRGDQRLEVRDLHVAYGGVEAVRGIGLSVHGGEIALLLGANGAGKTSTVRSVVGAVPRTEGEVVLDGAPTGRTPPHRLARQGLVLVPEGRRIITPLSVEDNLLLGGFVRGGRRRLGSSLDEMYALFPVLQERRDVPGGLLSGGEQQMLALARAWMATPRVLLMDEPTMGLAPVVIEVIVQAIRRIADTGVGVLMVEQNAMALLPVADTVYVMEQGRLVHVGTPESVLEDQTLVSAFLGIDAEDLDVGSHPPPDGQGTRP